MATASNTKSTASPSYTTLLGLMYRRFVLDCSSDLGYAVSLDFIYRPELYQDVDSGTSDLMATLQSSIDKQPTLPAG